MTRLSYWLLLTLPITLAAVLIVLTQPVVALKAPAPAKDKVELYLGGGATLKMVRIPAKGKTFWMGSPEGEKHQSKDEVQHEVEFSRDFYLGATEVTQAQFRAVMGTNPSFFCMEGEGKEKVAGLDTDDFPVENVTWEQAKGFCTKVGEKRGDGQEYRLPTEAEWEFACREGRSAKDSVPFYLRSGPTSSLSGGQINFDSNFPYGDGKPGKSLERTAPCGSFAESVNAFGLYDMHGNVWEWCGDWYGMYPTERVTDPTGPPEGAERVIRGGGWRLNGGVCRAADRYGHAATGKDSDLGFRLAMVPVR
jgi:formylglycine-generating enzyme